MTTTPVHIDGFYAHYTPATQGPAGRPAGGVAVLLVPSDPEHSLLTKGHNFLIVKIGLVLLVAAYFSPALHISDLLAALSDILSQIPANSPILLAGDFNCRIDQSVSQ
jgi:hypothetical protein